MNEVPVREGVISPQMQRALYLRWRPRSFAEVVGQEAVTRTLRNAVVRGTVAHGYLLCGPRGTGKTSLARILFKALNCQHATAGDPCTRCPSCQASDAGRAMDLIEIDAASNRGIDDIRSLRERVRFAPTEGKWKVYIVDEAHQLTAAAWDAFLKTLEEPPPHTVFVLATTAVHKVPATIVSRCQRFDLGRIPQSDIARHLSVIAAQEQMELDESVANRVARLARGGLRDAISMLEQVAAFAGTPITLEAARQVLGLVRGDALRTFVDALALRNGSTALQVLEDVAQEGVDLHQFLDEVLSELRSVLLARAGAERAVEGDPEERTWIRSVAQQWAPGEIVAALRAFTDVPTAGADDHQLLVRLELAAATITEFGGASAADREPRREPDARPTAVGARLGDDATVPVAQTTHVAATAAPPARLEAPASEGEPPSPTPKEALGGIAAPGAQRMPSLASVQARWLGLLERFQGTLFEKMLLGRVAPVGLDDGTLAIGGKLERVDLQRLDSARKGVEALLAEEFGRSLAVRFVGAGESPGIPPEESVADYATELFGGQLVSSSSLAGEN